MLDLTKVIIGRRSSTLTTYTYWYYLIIS